ncbi:MAG: autotransporter domain-containing protein [Enhydrobacter sp.]|nr:MAG: autotransporter domain-containing protein [Enhydrobacter sp.]
MTIQEGAVVGTGITLNDNNSASNLGTISVGDTTTGIAAGNNNQISNTGSILAGESGVGITVTGLGSIFSSGSIVVGNVGVGISGQNVTNTGSISVGDDGFGIVGTTNFGMLTNRGSIVVGENGAGIQSAADSLSVINSGSIAFGNCGSGIDVSAGTGHTVTNTGSIRDLGCGGIGILSGDNSTISNSGSITVGETGAGIAGGMGMSVLNTGTIVTGAGGVGIEITDGSAVNSGTIVIGDGLIFSVGIFSLWGASQITNTGTIIGGDGASGLMALGSNNALTNSGIISVGQNGIGLLGQGDGNMFFNSGTVTLGEGGIGILQVGDGGTANNSGTINALSDGAQAMLFQGNGATAINSGTINVGSFALGIGVQGDGATITNFGTLNVAADGTGVAFAGINNIVSNQGTINVGACGVGIDTSLSSDSTIFNSGSILGAGCSATAVALGDNDTFSNSGRISAPFSVVALGSNTTLTNTGTLDGSLLFDGAGGNTLTNSGLITISSALTAGNGVTHLVDGTFVQGASGVLALRVLPNSGTGNYDVLQVMNSVPGTGVATLGGTLRVVPQPGLFNATTTYPGVLTFASSNGRFANVETGLLFLNGAAIYNNTSVDLVLTRVPFNQAFTTGGTNEQAIGTLLEQNYSPDLTGVLATFYAQLLQSTAPNTLAQLTGEVATAPQTTSFATFGQFMSTILSQTGSSRIAGSSSSISLAMAGTGSRVLLKDLACASDTCDSAGQIGYTAWMQGFGGAGSIDRSASIGSSRIDFTTAGGAIGMDARVAPDLALGLALGTGSSIYSLTDLTSNGGGRAILLALYGTADVGPGYIDGALALGYNGFASNRTIGTGAIAEQATASFAGYQYGGRIEGGWRFALGDMTLTPFGGLTVMALSQPGYTEVSRNLATGAPGMLGLTYQAQTATSVRSGIGAQFEASLRVGEDILFRPRLRLGWAHEFNTERTTTASLGTLLPSAAFTVRGATPAADALLVGAGFDLQLASMVRLYGQFDGDFAANAQSYSGTGGVRLIW